MRMVVQSVRLWILLTANSFQINMVTRFSMALFLTGKILRFILFLVFILSLFRGTANLAGYSASEVLLFYMTFACIDSFSQFLFREVYRFRSLVVSGDFDLILTKPTSALFRALLGSADPLDCIMMVPFGTALVWVASGIEGVSVGRAVFFLILFANGMLISAAFHIFVLSCAILTTEIDHMIMIYRDFSQMVRLPIDIYKEPLRSLLLFAIPVGFMVTVPAQTLLGIAPTSYIIGSFGIGLLLLFSSFIMWKTALRHYSSASS